MQQFISNSTNPQQLFTFNDANTVANVIMAELNLMVNSIAPSRIIQTKKKHAPYLNAEAHEQIQQRQQQYKLAVQTDTQDDWRLYRNIRNTTKRLLDRLKTAYYTNKFTNNSDKPTLMWGTLKQIANNNDQTTPQPHCT